FNWAEVAAPPSPKTLAVPFPATVLIEGDCPILVLRPRLFVASPLYRAVITCWPSGREDRPTVRAAVPAATLTGLPSVVPLSWNVTVPVEGVVRGAVTVAVRVTVW